MRLLFQISVLLLTLQSGTSTDSCLPQDHRKIRLTGPRSTKNEGAVQLCVLIGNKYLWHYIQTQDGWTNDFTAANLACRELGLSYTGVRANTAQLMRNADTVTKIINCNDGDEYLRDCLPSMLSVHGRSQVAGLICNCIERALRLVDGSSYNEGRVEVCSNGRWGTVCGDGWTEREAALVCSRLGYPQEHATLSNFGEGSGPLYNITCPSTGSDDQECIPMITSAPSSCAHSMDVGVRCLPFTDAYADLVNEVITTLETLTACSCQQCTPPTPPTIAECTPASTEGDGNVNEMTTSNTQPTISIESSQSTMAVPVNKVPSTTTETPQPSDGATTESSITQSTIMSTSGTLGALIGLLAAALVVVVTGWIVSCVYLQRKINKKCKYHTHTTPASTSDHTLQLNNPVYDGSTTVPHTTYSSHGPSYEVIDTNDGAGHSYRGAATRPHPPTTHPVSNEEYSKLDTNRENEYHTLESNTGDGQYSMVGHTDPQDYEVPVPPQEEEYSTLKHR